jgi:hypothetical protein
LRCGQDGFNTCNLVMGKDAAGHHCQTYIDKEQTGNARETGKGDVFCGTFGIFAVP